MSDDLLYTMKDVARLLKVSLPHAYVMVKKHNIPTIRLGERSTRVSKYAFDKWVREQNGIDQGNR